MSDPAILQTCQLWYETTIIVTVAFPFSYSICYLSVIATMVCVPVGLKTFFLKGKWVWF